MRAVRSDVCDAVRQPPGQEHRPPARRAVSAVGVRAAGGLQGRQRRRPSRRRSGHTPGRAITFQLAEVAVTGAMVRAILDAIRRLQAPPLCV